MNEINLLFGDPYKITEGVYLRIPTISEMLSEKDFSIFTTVFTIRTREIFTTSRNVDALEKEYPTLFELYSQDETDNQLGRYFGGYDKVSDVVINALNYWIIFDNLPSDYDKNSEDGFTKLSNGKIIHGASEWIIDRNMFIELSKMIKVITGYKADDELVAPSITSDAQYEAWMNTYKGRLKKAKRNSTTLADKILILSISSEAFIPLREIKEMTVYTFNKLFNGLSAKDSYDKEFLIRVSGNFKSQGNLTHWKDKWKHL